jgi:death-on-curing protein
MRYLTLAEVVELHRLVLRAAGGAAGIRSLAGLESALAQPKATFEGRDLHPTLSEKAAALGFSLIQNHAFVDGNKRVAHAAMETFLVLNGNEIVATTEDQERLILGLASGQVSRENLVAWLRRNVQTRS